MQKSRYTFTTPATDKSGVIIANYLTGAIDFIDGKNQVEFMQRFENDDWQSYQFTSYMLERGYLFETTDAEEQLIQQKYFEFTEEYDNTEVQLIFAPTYTCNFACTYCFQEEYDQGKEGLTQEITDKFFEYIENRFTEEKFKPYITLFGGEPFQNSESQKKAVSYFLEQSAKFGYQIAAVTNGYALEDYIPIIKNSGVTVKEIQVTVDGDQQAHDSRRITKGKQPTFERISAGISAALEAGFRINLRSIIDKRNMASLPNLARYAKEAGWLDYPDSQWITTLGRNYELHSCQKTDSLYNRLEMYQDFLVLAQKEPVLAEFHQPNFHGMKTLAETGELPLPVFDTCPAGKKEFAFDLYGDIYGCTASVGVPHYKLGNFLRPGEEDEDQALDWETRDVLTIEECKTCAVALSCGGGCGVLAANNHEGRIHAPDCRPVAELVAVGAEFYGINKQETSETAEVENRQEKQTADSAP